MLFTIGHSTRTWEEFVQLLKHHNITILVDVRMFPGSRRHPHFSREHFETELKKEGIAYLHMPGLGGRRKPGAHDRNAAWEEPGFRGYADYMESKEFRKAIQQVQLLKGNTALMCAEAVPWRCHRRLIADYLTVQGYEVLEIIDEHEPKVHALTSFAKVENGRLAYPSPQQTLDGTFKNP